MSDPMLDGIQRWGLGEIGTLNGSQYKMHPFNDGGYVLFSDLPALISRARADERGKTIVSYDLMKQRKGYAQGQRDERERIVAALEAVYRYGRDRDPSAFELEVYEFIQTAIKGDN